MTAEPATGLRHWQRHHIETVMQVAGDGLDAPAAQAHDAIIRASWQRCVHQHRLDPTRMQEAVIVTQAELRQHQARIDAQMDGFLHIARHGLEALYRQVAGLGYCVLLTDARGIAVDTIGDLALEPSLRRAGLYLGADWSEARAGTCGVGTCLSTGQALTVHLDDHFDATHIPLSCTTAPVFASTGELGAVLDISALSSPAPKSGQNLALQLVQVYAHHIENAAFLHRHRGQWVLRLSETAPFLDVAPEYLLALDGEGRVAGHNRRAQLLLEPLLGGGAAPAVGQRSRLIGQPLDRLFDATTEQLLDCSAARPAWQRVVRVSGGAATLHVLSTPPARRPLGPPMAAGPGVGSGLGPVAVADAGQAAAGVAAGRLSVAATAPAATAATTLPAPLAALDTGDEAMRRVLHKAARLADSPVSVLIGGETGTGKEWLARALHRSGRRGAGPFVAVNCAAIPETLIESELFGHLAGSFSGAAAKGKRGLVQEADGGTLFLDEIGDMPLALQARLLRVLAEREVLPLGATRPVKVDLRVIAATHAPLERLVEEARFRADLYWRLNGVRLALPALRERGDLGVIAVRMLREIGGGAPGFALSDEAMAALRGWRWPGNLRELRNALEGAAALCEGGVIGRDELAVGDGRGDAPVRVAGGDVPAGSVEPPGDERVEPMRRAGGVGRRAIVDEGEDVALTRAFDALGGNVSAVARRLGVSRMTVYRRLQRMGWRPGRGGGFGAGDSMK